MNFIKSVIKAGFYYSGASWLYGHFFLNGKAMILGYHCVKPESDGGLTISPRIFAMQMEYLSTHCNVLPLRDLVELLKSGKRIPNRSCVVTFDDGTIDNYEIAFPILKRFSIPATFFVIGQKLQEPGSSHFNLQQANEFLAAGHEIGGHSHTHPHLTKISSEEIVKELAFVQQFSGNSKAPPSFAYPYGDYNSDVAAAVKGAGYCCAITTQPGFVHQGSDLFALPRIQIDSVATSRVASFASRLQWIPRSSLIR